MLINFSNHFWGSSLYALGVGVGLGIFYFIGLWWTVRQIVSNNYVALLFLSSMFFRISVVMLSFYLLLGQDWQAILLALLGFTMLRLVVIRLTRLKQITDIFKPNLVDKEKPQSAGEPL
tara:strand:+ start:58514 stop:58870 length:357 start_codon:yes stop_codon:yes gene_type:complete